MLVGRNAIIKDRIWPRRDTKRETERPCNGSITNNNIIINSNSNNINNTNIDNCNIINNSSSIILILHH